MSRFLLTVTSVFASLASVSNFPVKPSVFKCFKAQERPVSGCQRPAVVSLYVALAYVGAGVCGGCVGRQRRPSVSEGCPSVEL